MDNLNDLISQAKLTHREVSNRVGNSENWFNDAYNNNEDIQISSFAKVLSVVSEEHEISEYKLMDIFNEKILNISSLLTRLSDEEEKYISDFIIAEKKLFLDILGDWASLAYKNKLNNKEVELISKVKDLISL
ncbi:hypothetical protein GCM10011351_27010 [Paraliobacillus quinghaiensis]|uniref:Uncharacterized protein n=2 Tax=Paraliobacillus quinghaiensis TaxID=470815 RepID=A0A917TVD5_9BACI|nr:hypothetical protein GCM10011351_27010 [Paraliobacillus quinghaiensis]